MEPEDSGLTKDWEEAKKALIAGMSTSKTEMMNTIFENQKKFMTEMGKKEQVQIAPMTEEEEADEIIRRLKTPPSKPLDGLRDIILPMIKRIIPSSIANEIIGVQPMTGPIADIKTMRHIFSDPRKEDPADEGTGS